MYHKIRITVVSLAVILVAILGSTETLAYFTDTESQTNTFTVGNISTVLKVYSNVSGDASSWTEFNAGGYTLSSNMDPIPYYLQVTNTGNIPVYQRFRVVIPIGLADALSLELPCTLDSSSTCSGNGYKVDYISSVVVGGTQTYAEYRITSINPLSVGGTTAAWPTTAIKIGTLPDDWENIATCAGNDANHCTFGIKVYSDVIQTTGFNDATAAFANFTETYD